MKNFNGEYQSYNLKDEITVSQLYSLHYFEYMNDFSFAGESHNFWEFCYVDKGTVNVMSGKTAHTLKKGDISFHKPNEFHNVTANGETAPNLIVVSFACQSPAMNFFRGRILQADELERNLLANIITEGRNCFGTELNDPYLLGLTAADGQPFGSEQLVKIHLQYLLIHLYRRYNHTEADEARTSLSIPKTTKSKSDAEIFDRIHTYLEAHLSARLTIEQICRDNLIGRSQLQKLFQEKAQQGIIEYYSNMKIDRAKYMIRHGRMNFTQISEQLGYASIHYFSRQFKKLVGMTPSEYASSVKALSDIAK